MWGPWGVLGVCWQVKVLALPTSTHSLNWANALALPTVGGTDLGWGGDQDL